MFGISDTTLAGIAGAMLLGVMVWLGLTYDNQAVIGAALGVVLPVVIAALGILSRSNATSVAAHQESLDKIAQAERAAARGDAQADRKIDAVHEVVQEVKEEVKSKS